MLSIFTYCLTIQSPTDRHVCAEGDKWSTTDRVKECVACYDWQPSPVYRRISDVASLLGSLMSLASAGGKGYISSSPCWPGTRIK
jgi:hypothetical protein